MIQDVCLDQGRFREFCFPPPTASQSYFLDVWERTTTYLPPEQKMRATFPFLGRQATPNIHLTPDGMVILIPPGDWCWQSFH
ncbi:MAG TPA: hypothetical protein VHY08_12115 [Bacillota bacterium]|nr:hypothetical protein [Bacillota bacterium]